MVDPNTTRVSQNGSKHVAPGLIAGLRQPFGVPRRLRPVLTVLVVVVWRCPHRCARRQHIRQGFGIGAEGVHTHGQVGHDADLHASGSTPGLGGS